MDWNHCSLITAIKTPYKQDGKIDFEAYDQLVQRQIDAKVNALVVCGTTGEGHLMDWEENLSLVLYSLQNFGQQIRVIGNTGSNFTKESLEATKKAFECGVHACLQINPYYGKTSLAGVLKHLGLALDIAPCFIYNVPSRTGQDIPPKIMTKLATHSNFLGVKECAGNDRISTYKKQNIACWSGNDDESFEAKHQTQAQGVISVAANIIPQYFRKLMDKQEQSLFKKCLPLIKNLFCDPNPIAVNTLLAMMGLCKPVFRLPYLPLPIEKQEILLKNLQDLEMTEQAKIIPPEKFKLIY